MTDKDSILGPGTDLVISLFSITLILVGIVSGLYLESINSQVNDTYLRDKQDTENQTSHEQLIDSHKKDIINLTEQLKSAKNHNLVLTKTVTALQEDEQQFFDKIATTNEKLETLLKKHEDIQNKFSEQEKIIVKLQSQFGVTKTTNKTLQADNTQVTRELLILTNLLEEYKTQLGTSRAENRLSKASIKSLQIDKENIQKTLTESVNSVKKLKKGHNNTEIPQRSTVGKKVYRVYARGGQTNYSLYFKPDGQNNEVKLSRHKIHQKLSRAKRQLGNRLFVAVIVNRNVVTVAFERKLQCEFWKYDYYKYANACAK